MTRVEQDKELSTDQMISFLEEDLYTWGEDTKAKVDHAEKRLAELRSSGALTDEQQNRLNLIGLVKSLDSSEP